MSVQKLMYKWWKDDDRYIQDPWIEITRLHDELKQMAITESALREFLTKLSHESNEYRHKIETENAELKKENASLRAERDLLLNGILNAPKNVADAMIASQQSYKP
jgi:predicted  nucleic acid-binding Zn-ribbon protein